LVAHSTARTPSRCFAFRQNNPDQLAPPAAAERLPGRTLYLGHYAAHFGHFLVETLATFWIFETRAAAEFDRIAFHPLAFGRHLTPFARHAFACFDIDPDRVVMLDAGPVRFEEVVVPERLIRPWNAADPALRPVYRRIREETLGPDAGPPTRRLYLSRRRLAFRDPRAAFGSNRVVANEVRLEELFARRGFEILYPETMDFAAQVAACGRARAIAGLYGSALHNALFMPEGGRVIELMYPGIELEVTNQALCNRVAGVEGMMVPFRGRSLLGGRVQIYDVGHVAHALAAALPEIGAAPVPALGRRLRGTLEIGYLSVRPVLRAVARRLASARRGWPGRRRNRWSEGAGHAD
jgi:capsular polysaccharide biosynthesis protein